MDFHFIQCIVILVVLSLFNAQNSPDLASDSCSLCSWNISPLFFDYILGGFLFVVFLWPHLQCVDVPRLQWHCRILNLLPQGNSYILVFWHSKIILGPSYIFPSLVLESDIFIRSLGMFFHGEWYLEANISALAVLIATGASVLIDEA